MQEKYHVHVSQLRYFSCIIWHIYFCDK